jgi:hypothetical protein
MSHYPGMYLITQQSATGEKVTIPMCDVCDYPWNDHAVGGNCVHPPAVFQATETGWRRVAYKGEPDAYSTD